MTIWHTVPEIISALVIGIILLNSGNVRLNLTARDTVFRYTLIVALEVMTFTVLNDVIHQLFSNIPFWLDLTLYTVIYLSYPITLMLLLWYIILFVSERAPEEHRVRKNIVAGVTLTLFVIYTILVIINLKTEWIFSISAGGTYIREGLNSLPFILALSQISIITLYLIRERHYIDPFSFILFRWLPALSLILLLLQIAFPDILLAGTAVMIVLLSIHLNFQTRKLSLDNLTQLPNREFFLITLSRAMRRKEKIALFILSLDDFKFVNDTFSNNKGNEILLALSNYLMTMFPEAQAFRYSGDEFALAARPEDIESIISTVRFRFNEAWVVGGIAATLKATSVSIVYPCTESDGENPVVLLDYAVRIAKTERKGEHLTFNHDVLQSIRNRREIIHSLHRSLKDETLRVVFQPIVKLASGKPIMYEALMRMNNDSLKEISPGDFIPIAEEIGIIDQLTLYVLNRVCAIQSELQRNDLPVPAISINFSASHFSNDALLDEILETIENHKIPKESIYFEVTEHTFLSKPFEEIVETMNRFLARGIHFNLDDFGTGYSNLSHIVNLPFKFVKIDKSLLWNEQKESPSRHLLSTISSLLREIGFDIIIEGVETKEQVEYLQKMEFPKAQGFYFSVPLELEDFSRVYRQNSHFPLD